VGWGAAFSARSPLKKVLDYTWAAGFCYGLYCWALFWAQTGLVGHIVDDWTNTGRLGLLLGVLLDELGQWASGGQEFEWKCTSIQHPS